MLLLCRFRSGISTGTRGGYRPGGSLPSRPAARDGEAPAGVGFAHYRLLVKRHGHGDVPGFNTATMPLHLGDCRWLPISMRPAAA